jgi:hypothetical protein
MSASKSANRRPAGTALAAAPSHFLIDAELDPFGFHLFDATVDMRLLELEIRNAVAQQATQAIALFENNHVVPDPRQLLRRRQAGGSGTDDGHFPAGLELRWLRTNPAFFPALVDDRMLDRLDPYRLGVDIERTSGFARRRTDAAGKVREIVGRVQNSQRLLPVAPVNQVVPVGMMLLTGQPVLQNGMPQSMQRAPCTLACSSLRTLMNSR